MKALKFFGILSIVLAFAVNTAQSQALVIKEVILPLVLERAG